jgi:hypothetical protein
MRRRRRCGTWTRRRPRPARRASGCRSTAARHSNGAEFYDETGRQIDFEIPGNDNGEVAELAEEEVNRWYAIRTEVEEEYGIRDLDRRIESETRRRYLESRPVEDVELPDVAS